MNAYAHFIYIFMPLHFCYVLFLSSVSWYAAVLGQSCRMSWPALITECILVLHELSSVLLYNDAFLCNDAWSIRITINRSITLDTHIWKLWLCTWIAIIFELDCQMWQCLMFRNFQMSNRFGLEMVLSIERRNKVRRKLSRKKSQHYISINK